MNNSKDRKNKILLAFACFVIVFITVVGLVVFNFLLFKPVVRALSGDYNRSNNNLIADDWNYLDEDFIGKDGATMTGGLDMDSFSLTGINTQSSDPGSVASVGFVAARVNNALGGTTYINWGRGDCGTDDLLYDGFSFGGHHDNISGGDNDVCIQMPADGEFIIREGSMSDELVPSMTIGAIDGIIAYNPRRAFIKCAMCYRNRSSCYVSYGNRNCTTALFPNRIYDGVVVAGLSQSHQATRERKCLNQNFDNFAGRSEFGWGAPLYASRIQENFGLPMGDYTILRYMRCALCCN